MKLPKWNEASKQSHVRSIWVAPQMTDPAKKSEGVRDAI